MARLPVPGSDQGSWGQILNDYLSQSHNGDGSLKASTVTAASIADGTITEAKLDTAARTKLNAGGGGGAVASVNGRTGSVVLTSADVGLDNVDDTADVNKPVSTAVQSALDNKANTTHGHAIADVSGLTAALSGKADTAHSHAIADVTGLQTALDNKISNGAFTLDNLSDVTATSATDGQSLVFNAGIWGPATVASGSPSVNDATSAAKGIVQLAGDLGGNAAAPTVPALTSKASTATTITGTTSLTGGGSLAANRTIALVNDAATPGNNYYYGTNASGTKGYFSLSAGSSDPTVGGDLSGTASNAQIVAGAVGTVELATNAVTTIKITDSNITTAKIADANITSAKLANDSVTEPKLAVSNSPATSQVLTWNGTALAWATPATGSSDPTVGGDLSGTASAATIVTGAVTAGKLASDAVTTVKIANGNVTLAKIATTGASSGQVLTYNGTALAWTTPSAGSGGTTYMFRNVTANATAANNDFIFVDSTSGAITITLPAATASGYVRIKRLNAAGNGVQVVAPSGAYIDGSTVGSHTINNQYDSQDFLSNGTNWYRV